MPRYLFQGSYTEQGLKGLLKEGGTKRREAVEQAARSMGGRLEAFYYAFGTDDFLVIVEMPSNVDASTVALNVNATGAMKVRTTVLITPEEVDQATKKAVSFRAPGQ